jgi:hypothetical protein
MVRSHRCVVTLAAALAVASAARGQTPPPPAPPAPAPAASPAATLETVRVAASDFPTTEWKLTEEVLSSSPVVQSLAKSGTAEGLGVTAKRAQFQSITAPSGAGSLVALEFEGDVDDATYAKLCTALWGDKHKPSLGHAELLARSGHVAVVLAFPPTSSIRNWLCGRLRSRFLMRLPDESDERRKKLEPLERWIGAKNGETGQKVFEQEKATYANCSAATLMLGQFHHWQQHFDAEVAAYARAVELDSTLDPFTDDQQLFRVLQRWGQTLHVDMQKYDRSVPIFERAAQVAASFGDPTLRADALYDKACGLCLSGKTEGVVELLRDCFAGDKQLVENARRDPDLKALKDDPAFKALLEGAKQ